MVDDVTHMTKKGSKQKIRSYLPHDEVRKIMAGLLLLEEVDDKKHKRYLDKEKVKLLNEHIFPSMANVIFFFRCTSRYTLLREIFEDDIKDLLGVRGKSSKDSDYGLIFSDLVRSILLPGLGFLRHEEICDKDFRLRLNQILQETVSAKVDLSLNEVFKNPAAQRVVAEDFNRAWAWVRTLAESVATEDNKPPHRTIRSDLFVTQLKESPDLF